jgi:endonuclease/exonuclease/phosphatase (EEP) superfamily protein YafD
LIANVYQDNRDVRSCIQAVETHDPDLVLLVEIDAWWKSELDKHLQGIYAYQVAKPLPNTYGIVLYSKFELIDAEIKFLVQPDVPSIHTKVKLPSGQIFKLYGLHPQPPVPTENPRSTERDAEILMVAKEAKKLKVPVIVAGDMNDVAWSYTTELFLKVSKLLDPRRGRGFYNTFHARYWFLRWPLDHIFCSSHFQLAGLECLPSIGSDHFPIMIELLLSDHELKENTKDQLDADSGDLELAEEKISKTGSTNS